MKILIIQIALFYLVMARVPYADENQIGLFYWPPTRPASPSCSFPCLLRSSRAERRDDYSYTPGFSGYKVHTDPAKWNEARKICKEEGGYLAIINSVAEADVICRLFNYTKSIVAVGTIHPDQAFIGIHDLFGEGDFVTVHDQSLFEAGFTRWGGGSPSISNIAENCGSIFDFGTLNDIPCETELCFICELPN